MESSMPAVRPFRPLLARAALTPLVALLLATAPSIALAYKTWPAGVSHHYDPKTGKTTDVPYPAFPNAGGCTRLFRQWSGGYEDDDRMEACIGFMGVDKYCADRDSHVVTGYIEAPGTWQGSSRTLKCSPNYHADSLGDQFVHIWTGIGEGLLTAAPFVAEGVLGVTCLYGQIYACAVLALEVSDQAGVKIPTEVGDALYIANKAPQCIDGDVVACAYLGVRGAKAVGLEIPGIPAIKVWEDQQKCTDGEFAACVRLGKEAADAGGIETGSLTGTIIDGQACLDGNKDTCVALAKEAIRDHVPLDGITDAAESAAACDNGNQAECRRLGENIVSKATGLAIAAPKSAPFGANACVTAVMAKGPVGLASMWHDAQATSVAVFPSDGSRFGASTRPSVRDGGWAATAKWAAADYNNDGVTDLLAVWDDNGSNTLTVRQSNGSHLAPVHWAIRAGTWVDTTVWLPGDFNGDGRMDVAGVWEDGGLTSIAVYLSEGTRFAAPTQWNTRDGGWSDGEKWAVGDFTGDGKADIVAIWDNGGSNTITLRQSTGAGFAQAHWATNAGGWIDSTTWLAGDYNGDGRLDLAAVWHDGDATSIAVYASDGHRFPGWNQWSTRDGGWIDNARWVAGDYDGDGKTDLAAIWNNGGSNTLTVRQSNGAGFSQAHWAIHAGGWSNTAAWCSGQFPSLVLASATERASDHRAITALLPPGATETQRDHAGTAVLLRPAPSVAFARVKTSGPTPPICDAARSARARNSPAAPALERQCTAAGGSFAPTPPAAQ
jgi:hypothetical protein